LRSNREGKRFYRIIICLIHNRVNDSSSQHMEGFTLLGNFRPGPFRAYNWCLLFFLLGIACFGRSRLNGDTWARVHVLVMEFTHLLDIGRCQDTEVFGSTETDDVVKSINLTKGCATGSKGVLDSRSGHDRQQEERREIGKGKENEGKQRLSKSG
jgi:hypothetical protein